MGGAADPPIAIAAAAAAAAATAVPESGNQTSYMLQAFMQFMHNAPALMQNAPAPPTAAPPAPRFIVRARTAQNYFAKSGQHGIKGQGKMGEINQAYKNVADKAPWEALAKQDKARELAEIAEAQRLRIPYQLGKAKKAP